MNTFSVDRMVRSESWGEFTFENDAFGVIEPSDDGYTNGIAYAWGKAPVESFADINIQD